MLTTEEVQAQSAYLALQETMFARQHMRQHVDYLMAIQAKRLALMAECPHKNQNAAQYVRWCCDCGMEWSTT